MKRSAISDALGKMDTRYIDEALLYQRSRKGVVLRRFGAFAAALILAVGILYSTRFVSMIFSVPRGFTLIEAESSHNWGASSPDVPPTYWENSLYAKVYTKKGSYKPQESMELRFLLGLTDNRLGEGDLIVRIEGEEFVIESPLGEVRNGELVIEDFTSCAYTQEDPLAFSLILTPHFAKDWARGIVKISFYFRFDDEERFISEANDYMERHWYREEAWHEYTIHSGMLRLEAVKFDYASDGVSLWISKHGNMLLSRMLMYHYDTWQISGKELMRIYYEYLYEDTIYAAIDAYREETHEFKFSYISKNIRYEKTEMIRNEAVWALSEEIWEMQSQPINEQYPPEREEKERQLARMILDHMYDSGVITEAEYQNELEWMAQATHVGVASVAYSGKMGDYARRLRKYIVTHTD